MDTSLLAEPKDHQLARLERASREPGHPSQRAEHATWCADRTTGLCEPVFWDVHLGWRLRDASL